MSVITSIEPQKKNPHRFNIFIDGQFAFGADEDLVVNNRLIVGKQVGQVELEKLLYEAEVGKLMERMYGLFSIRQRSEKEVRDYFRAKNYGLKIKGKEEKSDLVVEQVIERLKQKGLINDLEFAKAWVEGRRKSKQKGVRALKMELYQKGVEREIVEEVVGHGSWVMGEEELAKQALEKKMKAWQNLDPQIRKKKSTEFLLRKGFEYEIARSVVEKFFQKE